MTATSIPGAYIPEVGFQYTDKLVHLSMYGVLAFLISRALDVPVALNESKGQVALNEVKGSTSPAQTATTRRTRAALVAFAFCVAMGAADELHQLYIPGRDADVKDWIADSSGGLIGAAAWMLRSQHKASRQT